MSGELDFALLSDDDVLFRDLDLDSSCAASLTQLLDMNTQQLMFSDSHGQKDECMAEKKTKENKENGGKQGEVDTTGIKQTTTTCRFAAPLSASDIEAKKKATTPKTTQNATNWVVVVWKEWARYRNLQAGTYEEQGYPIPEDISNFKDLAAMDFWLQRFVHEVRRKDGNPYPPDTLKQISAGLQRYLRNERNVHVNFFKSDEPIFAGFRKALDSRMRELTNNGVGIEKRSADAVSLVEERKFWETGVFSLESSQGLSNAVFYYNGKVFGFRGGAEHIGVLSDQYSLGYDPVEERRFVKFIPRIRKNAQGGLKQSKTVTALMTPIIHYDRPESKCSVYAIFEKYLNLVPRCGPLYRKPLGGMKFSAGNIAQRDLKGMMKRFFSEAGLSLENRNISNHSGRVTLCSTLYNNKFSDKSVMSRSKHCSNAVHVYQKEDFKLNDEICSALEPPLEKEAPKSTEPCDMNNNQPKESEDKTLPSTAFPDGVLEINVPNNINIVIINKNGKKIKLEI